MIHPTYVAIACVALAGFATALYWWWLHHPERLSTLSEAVQRLVSQAARSPLQPHLQHSVVVPLRDGLSLYSKSRLLLSEAHRIWLASEQSIEDSAWHQLACETHAELARTFRWYMVERISSFVLPRRLPVYSLLLAESFSELVEIVSQLGKRSGDARSLELVASLA